jgi:hypothetical protein
MNAKNVEAIYPLSPMQQGMFFHTLSAPDWGVYFYQLSWDMRGDHDPELLRQAWQAVVDRQQALRTSFHWRDLDKPVQVVHRQVEVPFSVQDWCGVPAEELPGKFDDFLAGDMKRGFAMDQAPLVRVTVLRTAGDCLRVVWSYHHVLVDGWSLPILVREVFGIYQGLREGRPPALPPAPPYKAFISWLQKRDNARAEAYWRKELEGFTSPTRLGIDRVSFSTLRNRKWQSPQDQVVRLSAGETASLQAWCRAHRLTLNTLVQGAWALLLCRYSGQDDVVFGNSVAGRPAELPDVERAVGLFINTLPQRVKVRREDTVLPWLRALQERQAEQRQFEHVALVDIHKWSEVPRSLPLFETLLAFENYPVETGLRGWAGALGVGGVRHRGWSNFQFAVVVTVADGGLTLHVRTRAAATTRPSSPSWPAASAACSCG